MRKCIIKLQTVVASSAKEVKATEQAKKIADLKKKLVPLEGKLKEAKATFDKENARTQAKIKSIKDDIIKLKGPKPKVVKPIHGFKLSPKMRREIEANKTKKVAKKVAKPVAKKK